MTTSQWEQTNKSSDCRQGNLAGGRSIGNGVWSSERLRIIDTCIVITGYFVNIENHTGSDVDNDFKFELIPDDQYK